VKITKETINFQIVETEEIINLKGVWQPMSPKQISILPEGQRSWSWFTIHCNSGSKINIDDIISKDGTRFRVMQRLSYPEYGYYEYHVCLDYQVPSGELYDRS